MDRYKLIKEIGDGTFGRVWRAINRWTGEIVAIKQMKKKYYSWGECMNLREVKSLRKMDHPSIIKLKEVIRESDVLYFVFEYMDCNLYQFMRAQKKQPSEAEVRNWSFQVFQALSYMHKRGYFHRDLKPENLLVNGNTIKIADFGLAREVTSQSPYTEYVSTRWYRAPEVLLQSSLYGPPVDMWAMGAIIAELFTLKPLFPGSNEMDELYKICSIIGAPTQSSWASGILFAEAIAFEFPQLPGIRLSTLIPSASENAIDLILSLCSWDPAKRPTASTVLQHPFFQACYRVQPSLYPKYAMERTPSDKGAWERKNRIAHPKTFSNARPGNDLKFSTSDLNVHRKVKISFQQVNKMENQMKGSTKQLTDCRPNLRNNPASLPSGRDSCLVRDSAEKMAHLSLNCRRQPLSVRPSLTRTTVGWHGNSDLLYQSGKLQHIQNARRIMS